jgi:cytochrome c556
MRIASLSVLAVVMSLACGCRPASDPASAEPPSPYRATATLRDVMQSVVAPSAQGLWEAVGTISNAKGTVHLEPRTDAEWAAVRRHAITLLESANILLVPGRHIAPTGAETLRAEEADPGAELPPAEIEKRVNENWQTWTAMTHALNDSAMAILKTVDAKDARGLETTGSDLDAVCESCHLTFWYPPQKAPVAGP